jgi:phosphoribosylaminoimidazole-succinocarboxamide synthase
VELVHSGKIRDLYADGPDLLLVASDKISVYDVVLPTPIPDKGKILTQLSLWWFARLGDIVPNHVISATDVPPQWAGRAVRCRRLEMIPVECIARGYLAGLGLDSYRASGSVSGVPLPPGLAEGSKLPEPVFTPSTKATSGHDEFVTFDDVVAELGASRGVIIADTKLEFGWAPDGSLVLADEVLTSDSSRFWAAEDWQPGRPQRYLDKQFVRDWSSTITSWDRRPPGPPIPAEVVDATRRRYVEAYERITQETWRED